MKTIVTTIMGLAALSLGLTACSSDDLESRLDNNTSYEQYQSGESPFSRAAPDPRSLPDFRRTYGVGFSYDAIYGKKCNLMDIRCQVLDLKQIEALERAVPTTLVMTDRQTEVTIESKTAFSRSEYEQNAYFTANADANLILINGHGEGGISLWEGGETNSFYCSTRMTAPALKVSMDGRSLASFATKGHPELLTPSFREAISWMEKHPSTQVVDSFLTRYGSHVVVAAVMGGCINVEMKMNLDSLLTVRDAKMLGNLTAGEILKMKGSSESYSKELNLMNSAECMVSVKGGDLSTIPHDVLHFTFGQRPDLTAYINKWLGSISYDPNDLERSNLEMTRQDTQPIWDFIPNKAVADRVRVRVMEKASDLLRKAGYQNGVNTIITIPQSVTTTIGSQRHTFQQPACTNIICGGRYVATICRERISDINPSADVNVVYPIYDRQANLSSGFCISGGKAYKVRNLIDGYIVTELGEANTDKVYLNAGVPGMTHYENVTYQENHPVIGCEWPYSITKEGTIDQQRPYYLTYKSGRDFLLRSANGQEQKGQIEGLPNWEYDKSRGRMVRSKDYYYYWNPKEISY